MRGDGGKFRLSSFPVLSCLVLAASLSPSHLLPSLLSSSRPHPPSPLLSSTLHPHHLPTQPNTRVTTQSGEAICWQSSSSNTHTIVPSGETWAQVSAGSYNSCGVTTSGKAICWGSNTPNARAITSGVPSRTLDLAPAGFWRNGKTDVTCPTATSSWPGAIAASGCTLAVAPNTTFPFSSDFESDSMSGWSCGSVTMCGNYGASACLLGVEREQRSRTNAYRDRQDLRRLWHHGTRLHHQQDVWRRARRQLHHQPRFHQDRLVGLG